MHISVKNLGHHVLVSCKFFIWNFVSSEISVNQVRKISFIWCVGQYWLGAAFQTIPVFPDCIIEYILGVGHRALLGYFTNTVMGPWAKGSIYSVGTYSVNWLLGRLTSYHTSYLYSMAETPVEIWSYSMIS